MWNTSAEAMEMGVRARSVGCHAQAQSPRLTAPLHSALELSSRVQSMTSPLHHCTFGGASSRWRSRQSASSLLCASAVRVQTWTCVCGGSSE